MKNNSAHPARSADFLSRLHDGELTAAERAHFESHRAHCADCRKAAQEFEAALSLFRASSTSPPPPDLSARILRRLQAATPRRAPFGVVFGINLKWAAAFAVAILATIVGSVVVIQRESVARSGPRETPIPVLLQSKQPPAAPRDAPASDAGAVRPRAEASKPLSKEELAPTAVPAPERYAPAPPPQAAPLSEGKVQAPARRSAEAPAPRAARAMDETSAPLLRSAERPGGEGASGGRRGLSRAGLRRPIPSSSPSTGRAALPRSSPRAPRSSSRICAAINTSCWSRPAAAFARRARMAGSARRCRRCRRSCGTFGFRRPTGRAVSFCGSIDWASEPWLSF